MRDPTCDIGKQLNISYRNILQNKTDDENFNNRLHAV